MPLHHDDEQRSIRLRTPMRPKGYGDVTPFALLPPLNDVPASLSARRQAACGRTLWGRVTAKRHRILGDEDETMPLHCEESATTKTVPFRRNPTGAWGFAPRALSFVGYDETASCPPLLRARGPEDPCARPHRVLPQAANIWRNVAVTRAIRLLPRTVRGDGLLQICNRPAEGTSNGYQPWISVPGDSEVSASSRDC